MTRLTSSTQKNGPASPASDPSRGSNPEKDIKNMERDSTAASARQENDRRIRDAIDLLAQATSVSELLHMAGDSLWHNGRHTEGQAIMTGVGVLADMLKNIEQTLNAGRHEEGGAA